MLQAQLAEKMRVYIAVMHTDIYCTGRNLINILKIINV